MKKIFLILFFAIAVVSCKGKDGKDGSSGGSMQRYEGTITVSPWNVQVDGFGSNDTVTVYYANPSDLSVYYELKGPDSLPSSAPYYDFSSSGSGIIVEINNVAVGSKYRVLVFRPSTVI